MRVLQMFVVFYMLSQAPALISSHQQELWCGLCWHQDQAFVQSVPILIVRHVCVHTTTHESLAVP